MSRALHSILFPYMMGRISAPAVSICLLLSAFASMAQPGKQQAGSAPATTRTISIGDITVTGFTSSRVAQGAGGFHILGPGTIVRVPDKKSQSTLVFHADDIRGVPEDDDPAGYIELIGHIGFTVDQHIGQESRHVSGTADRVTMHRSQDVLRLIGDVRIRIEDGLRLSGPANIACEQASIDMNTSPAIIEAVSTRNTGEMTFTPGTTGSAAKERPVRISRFQKGLFHPGVSGEFSGTMVCLEITQAGPDEILTLKSPVFAAEYERGVLSRIRTKVGITYHAQEMEGPRQELDGSAEGAVAELARKTLSLTGHTSANLYDRKRLTGPGVFRSGGAVVDMSVHPYKFRASGPSELNSVRFTVASAAKDGVPVPVSVSGYQDFNQLDESTIEFTGPATNLEVGSVRTASRASSRSNSLRITIDPAAHMIRALHETGDAVYDIKVQKDGRLVRSISGSADSLDLEQVGKRGDPIEQRIRLHRFACKVRSPESLREPGSVRGDDIELELGQAPTHLLMSGAPDHNDVLLKSGKEGDVLVTSKTRYTHLFGFATAELRIGRIFSAEGAATTVDIEEPAIRRNSHLLAAKVRADFDATTTNLSRVTAEGHVALYSHEQSERQPALLERGVDASADFALYDLDFEAFTLRGKAAASLHQSDTFAAPATIRSSQISIGLGEPFYSVEASVAPGAPKSDSDIVVFYRNKSKSHTQSKPASKAQKSSPIVLHLAGFQTAKYVAGKDVAATGPLTSLSIDRSQDSAKFRLEAPDIRASLMADGSELESAEASGGVHFSAQRGEQDLYESITGSSAHVGFDASMELMKLDGSVHISYEAPGRLSEPAVIRGEIVNVSMADTSSVFTCSGSSGSTTLNASPWIRDTAPSAATRPLTVHEDASHRQSDHFSATGFEFAVFQPGSAFSVDGAITEIQFFHPVNNTHIRLNSSHCNGVFSKEAGTLTHMSATGSVKFEYRQLRPGQQTEQVFAGTAAGLDCMMLPDRQSMDITATFALQITDDTVLAEPATISAEDGQVLHIELAEGAAGLRYEAGQKPFKSEWRPKIRNRKAVPATKSAAASTGVKAI